MLPAIPAPWWLPVGWACVDLDDNGEARTSQSVDEGVRPQLR
jgi:hypothetical protein